MEYALLEELRDAGFPFQEHAKTASYDLAAVLISTTGFANEDLAVFKGEQKIYQVPALSNLIRACGDGFMSLHTSRDLASRGISGWWCWREGDTNGNHFSTPEEAVARLWLALNKK